MWKIQAMHTRGALPGCAELARWVGVIARESRRSWTEPPNAGAPVCASGLLRWSDCLQSGAGSSPSWRHRRWAELVLFLSISALSVTQSTDDAAAAAAAVRDNQLLLCCAQ